MSPTPVTRWERASQGNYCSPSLPFAPNVYSKCLSFPSSDYDPGMEGEPEVYKTPLRDTQRQFLCFSGCSPHADPNPGICSAQDQFPRTQKKKKVQARTKSGPNYVTPKLSFPPFEMSRFIPKLLVLSGALPGWVSLSSQLCFSRDVPSLVRELRTHTSVLMCICSISP